jgi:opacity protein-like surface antigen
MKALLCAAAAVACMAATPAAAAAYGTIGLSHIDAEAGEAPELGTMGFEAITARAGVNISPYFGVEGEVQFGWEDATTTTTFTNEDDEEVDVALTTSLKNDFGVYLVGRLPMTENASLVGRVGYGRSHYELESSDPEFDVGGDQKTDGYRYGVGAEFFFNDVSGVRVDFTRTNTSEVDADAYTVSYVHRFGY